MNVERPEIGCVNADYSYMPIDVGFDLRMQDMPIELPGSLTGQTVAYEDVQGPAVVSGTREEIAEALVRAGYRVIFGHTDNGREIRCEPIDSQPPGARWAVQPANDNYWVTGRDLAKVMSEAGWADDSCVG